MKQLFAIALVLASGCGYTLVNNARVAGVRTLALVPFVEDEPAGLAPDLARELASLLAADGYKLTLDRSAADAVLEGFITSASSNPGVTVSAGVSSFSLRVRVSATLVRKDGESVDVAVSAADDYVPTGDALSIEASRREAMRRVAITTAKALRERLLLAGLRGS